MIFNAVPQHTAHLQSLQSEGVEASTCTEKCFPQYKCLDNPPRKQIMNICYPCKCHAFNSLTSKEISSRMPLTTTCKLGE